MNKKIKTLAKVAGYDEINKAAMKLMGFDPEKFAELIVKECGRYLDSPEFIGRCDLDWSIVLNEHFGVKK